MHRSETIQSHHSVALSARNRRPDTVAIGMLYTIARTHTQTRTHKKLSQTCQRMHAQSHAHRVCTRTLTQARTHTQTRKHAHKLALGGEGRRGSVSRHCRLSWQCRPPPFHPPEPMMCPAPGQHLSERWGGLGWGRRESSSTCFTLAVQHSRATGCMQAVRQIGRTHAGGGTWIAGAV